MYKPSDHQNCRWKVAHEVHWCIMMQRVCWFLQCKQVHRFYIHLIYVAAALTPGPVQNLTAVVDTHTPSVTLNWDPPANAAHAGYVTKYEIHLQDRNDNSFHGEKVVNGSTTTTVITRESGLRPLSTFTFKVRACSRGNASQEWMAISRFIGIQVCNGSKFNLHDISLILCQKRFTTLLHLGSRLDLRSLFVLRSLIPAVVPSVCIVT